MDPYTFMLTTSSSNRIQQPVHTAQHLLIRKQCSKACLTAPSCIRGPDRNKNSSKEHQSDRSRRTKLQDNVQKGIAAVRNHKQCQNCLEVLRLISFCRLFANELGNHWCQCNSGRESDR